MQNLYFYEQDGKFYEFFTGRFLGVRSAVDAPGYEYVGFEEFGYKIPLTGYSEKSCASRVTGSEFADEVRPFMPYRAKIKRGLTALLNGWREERAKELRLQAAQDEAEVQRKKRSEQNVRWLEDMLNNRH